MRPADAMAFCRGLPHATEDVKWDNDLVFSVGGKMFAVFDQTGGVRFSFKCTPEEFARLTTVPGVVPAPYLARHHWVSVVERGALPAAAVRSLLRESYELVLAKLPRKQRDALGG